MTDKLDEAIAAAASLEEAASPAPALVELEQNSLTIDSTGRPFVFIAPADLTLAEIDEICAWMLTALRGRQVDRSRQAAVPQIAIARTLPGRSS